MQTSTPELQSAAVAVDDFLGRIAWLIWTVVWIRWVGTRVRRNSNIVRIWKSFEKYGWPLLHTKYFWMCNSPLFFQKYRKWCWRMSMHMATYDVLNCSWNIVVLILIALWTYLCRFKPPEERVGDIDKPMAHFLPILLQRFHQVLRDESNLSVTVQKHILKLFFSLVQASWCIDLPFQP